MSEAKTPFDTLRDTEFRETSRTPSPSASPSGFTASSAWSDDGIEWEDAMSPECQADAGQVSSNVTAADPAIPFPSPPTGLAAKVSPDISPPQQALHFTDGLKPHNQLKSILEQTWHPIPKGDEPVLRKKRPAPDDDPFPPFSGVLVKLEDKNKNMNKNKDVGAPSGTSQTAPPAPGLAPAPWSAPPPPNLAGIDPRTRLTHAASAMDLLQRILEKVGDSQTALFEENARLKEMYGIGIDPTDHQTATVNTSSQSIKRLKMEKRLLAKELSDERSAHAITADKLRRCQLEASARENQPTEGQISQTVITELALKLIEQGPSAATSVAGLLFDEVARVAAIREDRKSNWDDEEVMWKEKEKGKEKGKEKEKPKVASNWVRSHQEGWKIQRDKDREAALGPSHRLMNLEGVVDVTLGRVGELEKDVRRIKGFFD